MPAPIHDRCERVLRVLVERRSPTLSDMVSDTGMSRSTCKRTLRELERAGRIRRHAVLGGAPVYVVTR